MTKTVFTYGIIAGIISSLPFLFMPHDEGMDMTLGMIVGFAAMILAFALIFFAVRSYRDKKLGGVISFGKAFLMGLYITLIASVMYASVWEVYYNTKAQNFMEVYTKAELKKMRDSGKSEAEITKAKKEMDEWTENYKNPVFRFTSTIVIEILPVGVLMSLIAAGVLRRRERLL